MTHLGSYSSVIFKNTTYYGDFACDQRLPCATPYRPQRVNQPPTYEQVCSNVRLVAISDSCRQVTISNAADHFQFGNFLNGFTASASVGIVVNGTVQDGTNGYLRGAYVAL